MQREAGPDVLGRLASVQTIEAFEAWVRQDMRPFLPHAALLVTVGRLYGSGSVATHRIGVDFPFNMIESLKEPSGALVDPSLHGWFRTGRPRFVDVREDQEDGVLARWRRTLARYGIRGIMVDGVLDHSARRFVAIQLCNPHAGDAIETLALFSSLVPDLARAACATVDSQDSGTHSRNLIYHPTLSLTAAELQIVELIAQGMSNKEIARKRGVSDSTVKTQVQRLGAKVGATRRAEIVAIAMPVLRGLPPQALIDYEEFF
jgi:DNA-binding CsgD family transcriptional regulator